MVELLVALAIGSLVMMGAGGLLAMGLTVRERVESAEALQRNLLDLRSLTSTLVGGSFVLLGDANDSGFVLCRVLPNSTPARLGEFRLEGDQAVYREKSETVSTTTDAFERVNVEYLVVGPTQQSWLTSADLQGARPVGARLRLVWREWTWPLLLWTERRVGGDLPTIEGKARCPE